MPSFGEQSQYRLQTCHPDLQMIANRVVETIDCTVIFGRRTTEEQQLLYKQKRTTLDGINERSKHQADPPEFSKAIDLAPYPVLWPDAPDLAIVDGMTEDEIEEAYAEAEHRLKRFHVFGGFVLGVGKMLHIPLRWGGDWDGDWTYNDQKFHDLPHFELR
jgi:peptidoglycan LD-endopeptidase CwlK